MGIALVAKADTERPGTGIQQGNAITTRQTRMAVAKSTLGIEADLGVGEALDRF